MTTLVRAKFDGKVLVPQGPVDLPVGPVLELQVQASSEPAAPLAALADLVESLPRSPGPMRDGAAQHDHYLYGAPKRP